MENDKTFIVAELSANHNGSLSLAKKTIAAAKEAGADAVKLQTYTADTITIDSDKDCFIEKGRGLGNTYIGEFPSFRIDHILHTPTLGTVSYTRDTIKYSDHYPVQSDIRF